LLSLTPIAAMDFRWPLAASNGPDTQLLEPIAQLVYRGSSTTAVGITNDDSQSFVFDTSNLFSYNRFSGIDRQETGLRANVGGHYLANFANGSWLDLVAGQSFFLAGTNALGVNDAAQVGASTGLGSTASYIVGSATGGLGNGFSGGGKIQVDPAGPRVTHAGLGVAYSGPWLSGNVSYNYTAANATLGTGTDHEIATNLSVPLTEYWSVQAGYGHNLLTNSWASVTGGATYDDGYFTVTGSANATPSSYGFTLHAGLKGPDGTLAAF
jgi:LPS-assembly protein